MKLLLCLLIGHASCCCKIAIDNRFFYNTNVKFNITRESFGLDSTGQKITMGKTIVVITIDSTLHDKIENLPYKKIMKLLLCKKTDWATNLLLYAFYERDAITISTEDDRNTWVKFDKKNDIQYWNSFLRKKR